MSTLAPPRLVAVDVGNVNLKYRSTKTGSWVAEPSLVRVAPIAEAFQLGDEKNPARRLVYVSGPAALPGLSYLVGSDVERSGGTEMPTVGSAEMRVRSDPYLLLHLYGIIASLPPLMTKASVIFAGGVPGTDAANATVLDALKRRLKGEHVLRWGDVEYQIEIQKTLIVPQAVGGIASVIFSPDGVVLTNGAMDRLRFGLDIGGGTTDFTARQGLKAIEGGEGGIRGGVVRAAEYAHRAVVARWPSLRTMSVGVILAAYRNKSTKIYVGGDPQDISVELEQGVRQAADEILAEIMPRWERVLSSGEVLLYGGGGEELAKPISVRIAPMTRVTLLPDPLFRVVEGIERLAKYQLKAV